MKLSLKIITYLAVIFGCLQLYYIHFDYRFETISDKKVYKSALIDPEHIEYYLQKYQIKTVVNLLDPGVQDRLNPAQHKHIIAQEFAIDKYNQEMSGSVKHVSIPSRQVPTAQTLQKFYKVFDSELNYPILIHCYHGTGRAQIYSAIYRIEYENYKNEDARDKTRFITQIPYLYKSSFADGSKKGDFLLSYKTRQNDTNSTFRLLSLN